ncbi:MAG TPA: lactate utilization protein [Alphaproteobacteria bacterium]|nr:lactate utilization protein [Alphaproteobacteria bacterium]
MTAREQILGGIRRSLRRGALDNAAAAPLERRLADPPRGAIPARTQDLDRGGLVDLFERYATEAAATVTRVPGIDEVPDAVAGFLASHNLPSELAMAPDPLLDRVPWEKRPLLRIRKGRSDGRDPVGLSAAFCGIAETATLMLASGADSPSTLNFLPDTHIVVLPASRVVGPMEDAWAKLRAAGPGAKLSGAAMPRTVNFITGPSRTGDIEQKILMGAHGPRRLHIVIVEDERR